MNTSIVTLLLDNCHSNLMKVIIMLELMSMQFSINHWENDKIIKETTNTGDNQGLCTTQIDSTNTDTIDTETDEDTELAEGQIAINYRQELTGDLLPSVVQFENLEKKIYQCAPGENNIPKYILLDNDFEGLAFPDLFPYGSGGYHSAHRKVKLPIRKYFQQCLIKVDGRFAQNIEYLFCALYIADIKQIESDATLAIWDISR